MRTRRLIASFCLLALAATAAVQTPEQYFGFRIGSDKKLVRWDKIVEYLQALVANGTDRVKFRNLGPTTNGNPFIMLEISSAENLRNLDRLKSAGTQALLPGRRAYRRRARRDLPLRQSRRLHHQQHPLHRDRRVADGAGTGAPARHRAIPPPSSKVLDNVILLLVPSLNPDGQIMVTDWYNKVAGHAQRGQRRCRTLYHHYTGHDNNRDMYLFSPEGEPDGRAGPVARVVPSRSGWTSTSRAPAVRASSPCPRPTRSIPTWTR